MLWPRDSSRDLISYYNNILLSPAIVLTYHLISDGLLFWYTKPDLSIVGNQLPILHYWEAHQLLSPLLESALSVIILCWDSFLLLFLLRFRSTIIKQLVLRWLLANLGLSLNYTPSLELERFGDQLYGLLDATSTALWDINVFIAISA